MRRRDLGFTMLAGLALAGCGGATDLPLGLVRPPAVGTTLTGQFPIGNRIIPLPPGPWRVVHAGVDHDWTNRGAGSVQISVERSLLVQDIGGRAVALVSVATASEIGVLWTPFGACLGPTLRRDARAAVGGNLDCQEVAVYNSGRSTTTPAYMAPLYEEGARRPGWLPDRWIGVGYSFSRDGNVLDLIYRFSPAVLAPAAWSMANGAPITPEQQAIVDRLAGWMGREREAVQAGFRGQPPARPMSAP